MPKPTLEDIVAAFGESARAKLSNPAISGSPEDQLRGPLEILIEAGLAPLAVPHSGGVRLVGETSLADIKTRPDYAVTVGKALVGFIEVKAPGKGADPRRFNDPHDKEQWSKLKSLPNLIYTDGNAFSLWRDGKLEGSIVRLGGDVETAGRKLTALDAHSPTSGPAITITDLIPDLHHYKGSFGGRVMPLFRDAGASRSNIRPEVLAFLADAYGQEVTPADVMAYLAATLAHPAFTERFRDDLVQPGLRVPLTADATLFFEAVALGREVIWLHCYGERFADPAAGRPKGPPRLSPEEAPRIPADGAIPGAPEPLPDTIDYDAASRRLIVGKGHIDNVPPEAWAYEVSGKQVLRQWFSYRKRDRTRPIIGDRRPPSPLDRIQPDHWLADYTSDLMNLLHVLGRLAKLEPRQADLLGRILEKPLIGIEAVGAAGDNTADSPVTAADA
ncbi:type ISP restriction/modification enzyme [Polymorphum gilvum]|uniref:Possible DNA methyltransferase n=1 Tax=Polymorphum gilvum (strain LMG 25793 / CGMCC 1.9160 / SL003B-26A1) TaxID=991905 RepID=F2J2C4_POLGS|nr:type ISP restriction/modification enzyme [Polymorphum gilvum]ADZ69820.1 Possible DNA methyltransferase [Polymorphum gilvum SL003B-26A1]